MRNSVSAFATAAMAAALASLSEFGKKLATSLGHNKGDYTQQPRPRKFQCRPARAGIKSLEMAAYEKRYGSGFRYRVGSKPFSARAGNR